MIKTFTKIFLGLFLTSGLLAQDNKKEWAEGKLTWQDFSEKRNFQGISELEVISKIPIAAFQNFFLHASLHSLPIHQRYELRNAPRLEKKSAENRLTPIFEMASKIFSWL